MKYSQQKKTLICVLGESASGKDHLVKDLCDSHRNFFRAVVSYTNRPKREGETNGKEHWFLSPEEFKKTLEEDRLNGNVIAYTKIEKDGQGYEYYASVKEINENNANVYIIDPRGFEYLKENFADQFNLVPVYINTTEEERRERARISRSDFDKEYEKRVEREKDQFDQFKENEFYFEIENHDGGYDYAFSSLDILCIGLFESLRGFEKLK